MPIRMTQMQQSWWGWGVAGTLTYYSWGMKMVRPLGKSLVVITKLNRRLSTSSHTLRYLSKWFEKLTSTKKLCINVYSRFIHNCLKMKAALCPPISKWTSENLCDIHTIEFFFSNKNDYCHQRHWWILNAHY